MDEDIAHKSSKFELQEVREKLYDFVKKDDFYLETEEIKTKASEQESIL
jgi:hypothetical protein